MKRIITSIVLVVLAWSGAIAREDLTPGARTAPSGSAYMRAAANCAPSTARAFLDINNVRAMILAGGDYWWDQGSSGIARYEIPKVNDPTQPRLNSLFAGCVWIGGTTNGTLRIAAQTYRQSSVLGVGFWPGPLNTQNATIGPGVCAQYDRLWKVDRSLVEAHKANTIVGPGGVTSLAPGYVTPQVILEWPGNGDLSQGQAPILAPFVNVGGDPNLYEPLLGDYPKINGDQSIWNVYNDKGNVSGSGSAQIGMEVQTQSFGYASNDELNNMTFYFHTIINRSTLKLDSCFMAQWVDPDLGNAADDFVGCDVPRGLGICYNGDDNDEGIQGYGLNPPSIGCDFFEGPFSDPNDGIDNDRDTRVDEIDTLICDGVGKTERCIMSRFVYFNNDQSPNGNPTTGIHAYNYMTGFWKDGQRMVYGGTGYPGAVGATNNEADMMFPDASDFQYGWSIGGSAQNPKSVPFAWSETFPGPSAPANAPGDRRFVQSGGPFTLAPGAVNYITIGIVWARASSGGAKGSFNQLLQADSKAQALFDNCFKTLDGPDAPDMNITEFDRELVFNLSYKKTSNNFGLRYAEIDPLIKSQYGFNPTPAQLDSAKFKFQGFIVYQLANAEVSTGELYDLTKARVVFQCDIKDGVGRIINFNYDPDIDKTIPRIEVDGKDAGIQMSFKLKRDAFATGSDIYINHKKYYFLAVAYAYNNFKKYNYDTGTGQPRPFFAGRSGSKVYTGIPHITSPEKDGLILKSVYGDAPVIKRIEGTGNGGQLLDLSDSTIAQILNSPDNRALMPVYKPGFGPVNVKIVNPKLVVPGKHLLGLYRSTPGSTDTINNNSKWFLAIDKGSKYDTIFSDTTIQVANEQIIGYYEQISSFKSLGISVTVTNAIEPGVDAVDSIGLKNGVLASDFKFLNTENTWLDFVPDNNNPQSPANWIRTGINNSTSSYNQPATGDQKNYFSGILNGTWTIMRFASRDTAFGPGFNPNVIPEEFPLADQPSVKVVITSNKDHWTRGWVLEMGGGVNGSGTEGNQTKGRVRLGTSVDKDGKTVNDPTDIGRGWFPGYAINMETGERLNISFGEDSRMTGFNGRDMMWNPSDVAFDSRSGTLVLGGKHFIYVMRDRYDQGDGYKKFLFSAAGAPFTGSQANGTVRSFYSRVAWVSFPIARAGAAYLSSDIVFNLRLAKRYKDYVTQTPAQNGNNPLYEINTTPYAPILSDRPTAVSSLEIIRVVPNPYYSISGYENSQIDNRVKITNLPRKCTISIYTTSGSLVRQLTKDDETTSVDWDLLNAKKVPISSGAYIIHVNSPDFGEKILRWFAVMRPIDLDTF